MSTARQAVYGLRWGLLGSVSGAALQLLLMAGMSRLLLPADFGLVAMAYVGLRLFGYFAQIGVGTALVQRSALSEQDLALALALSVLSSALFSLAACLLAPVMAAFFDEPRLTVMLQVLSLTLLLSGLGTVATATLRRQLRFRALALLDLAAYALGSGAVGLGAAWAGWGAWALVASALAQSALLTLGACWLAPHAWRMSLRGDVGGLLGYGSKHSLISFIEFIGVNADTVLIGRWLGQSALGVYNRAYLLAHLPTEKLAGILGRVLFPVLSHLNRASGQLDAVIQLSCLALGVSSALLSLGVSAAAAPMVALLLGAQWETAVPVVQVLALAMPPMFIAYVCGISCDALALLMPKLRLQALAVTALLGGLAWAQSHGVLAMAWVLVAVEWLRCLGYGLLFRKSLGMAWRIQGRLLVTVWMSGGLSYALVHAALQPAAGHHRLLQLAAAVAGGAIAAALSLGLVCLLYRGSAPAAVLRSYWPRWWPSAGGGVR